MKFTKEQIQKLAKEAGIELMIDDDNEDYYDASPEALQKFADLCVENYEEYRVYKETRKGGYEPVVFKGSYEECLDYCKSQDYPEEFCDDKEGYFGSEEETLEIYKS